MSSSPDGSSSAPLVPDFPVTEEGWPLSPDGYELLEEVGQGAFAKVVKAYCPTKMLPVAVKIMALENITTSMEEIQGEVKAMKLNRDDNVLGLYCCFVVRSDLWLVMPLMDKGSCYYILRSLRKAGRIVEGQGLPEDIIATLLREALQGLAYIHAQGQIHRDIKAGNILLNSEGRVAIADFGVAGWMTETGARAETERKTFVGTPCWMAPEVMEQMRGYNEKADMWSLGITALELAKGYAPYAKYAPMQVLIKTIREPPPSWKSYVDPPGVTPAVFSDKFHKFVARCLQKDPKAR
jgi:serine/threonine-protein kinase OSR1/STK39